MAHNLNTNKNTGKVSMMYYGETPWHRLGQKLQNPATAAEAIVAAGLDYKVEKRPISFADNHNSYERIPDMYATVRMDTMQPLGVVGKWYEPLQNVDAFSFFDSLVGKGEAIYHTAGALGKGEKLWIMAQLPGYIKLGKNDIVNKFLLLTNGHDGKTMVRAKLTPVRVVCENTLNMALRGSDQQVGVLHSKAALPNLETAWKVLGLSNQLYDQLGDIFKKMTLTKLSDRDLLGYVTKLVYGEEKETTPRKEAQVEKILELASVGAGAEMETSTGTVWGAYNAATEYADHVDGVNRKEESALKSLWFGSRQDFKVKAFELAQAQTN